MDAVMTLGVRLKGFVENSNGSIAIFFALAFPVMLGAGAFAIDMGSTYLERRTLQTAVDDAALAAAEWPDKADTVIRALLDDDGQQTATYQIVFGNFTDSSAIDPDRRFVPVLAGSGNAIRLIATRPAPVYFAHIFGLTEIPVSVQADAEVIPIVALSAGSRLAAVDPTILNAVVKPITGVGINLSVVDYQSLARSQIALGPLLQTLAGSATNLLAKDVLSQPIKLSVLLQNMAAVQQSAGDLVGASVLRKASAQAVSADLSLVLGDILKLDDGLGNLAVSYPGAALQSNISVLGILNAAMLGKTIGNTVSTGLTIPGLASTSVEVLIGEGLQTSRTIAVSANMPSVQTDQLRLRAKVQTTGLLPALGVGLNVPIELVAAGGTATVTSTVCSSDPTQRSVTVQAIPGVVKLAVGQFVGPLKSANTQDRLSSANLASTPIATITGSSYASIAQVTPVTLTFNGAEIGNGTVKTAKTSTILQSLIASLLNETQITVNLAGAGLPVPGLTAAIAPLISSLAQPLDSLLAGVLGVAGVSVGELDVRVDSLACNTPQLVI